MIDPSGWRMYAQDMFGNPRYILVAKDNKNHGRVLDVEAGILHEPAFLQSLLARGYWVAYVGLQDALPGLIEGLKESPGRR